MTDSYTPSINLDLPSRGSYQNTWDVPVNSNWSIIDACIGGTTTVSVSNSNITLTLAQAQCNNLVFAGTLSANITISLPIGFAKSFSVFNHTSGNFLIYFGVLDSSGTFVTPQQSNRSLVISDGTNCYFADQSGAPPGVIMPYFGTVSPAGFILCSGGTQLIVNFQNLYNTIGVTFGGNGTTTFGIPDLRGRLLAGLDNMGGTAAGILNSFGSSGTSLGAAGGEQSHTLVSAEVGNHTHTVTDPGHIHGIYDPQHYHNWGNDAQAYGLAVGTNGSFSQGASPPGNLNTTNASTNITINTAYTGLTINTNSGGSSHNNVQPTMLCNWIIKT